MNPRTELLTNDLDQARLYAWNDPLLDRKSFEARLICEPHLAELVAQAVEESCAIRAALSTEQWHGRPKAVLAVPSQQERNSIQHIVNSAWILTIAVAVAIVAVPVRWHFSTEQNVPNSSLARIWSELHSQPASASSMDPTELTIEPEDDFGNSILLDEDRWDRDLPDWLMAATAYGNNDRGAMP